MSEKANYVSTTIRVPPKLLEEIKRLSAEIGDSQNGTMLHLIYMGMKVYKGTSCIALKE